MSLGRSRDEQVYLRIERLQDEVNRLFNLLPFSNLTSRSHESPSSQNAPRGFAARKKQKKASENFEK